MARFSHLPGRKRILTGIQPTGQLHLGNYAGAIGPSVAMSQDPTNEVLLFCADWHGLTNRTKFKEPGAQTLPFFATLLALGFNCTNNALFLQSRMPELTEISWYLACATGVGLLERAHAYKDAVANGKDATCGLFYYPVLMASDILAYDAQFVPIGKDQAQHLEMCVDMAQHLNHLVGEQVFCEPKPMIQETPLLPGIDGTRKMSKSYGNTIPLFAPDKEIEKRVKEIKTDSKGLDDPKDPETCAVYQILKGFGSAEALAHMRSKLETGKGYGYGHAKQDFMQEHRRVFGANREKYEHFLNHPNEIWDQVNPGVELARSYLLQVRDRARLALGLK